MIIDIERALVELTSAYDLAPPVEPFALSGQGTNNTPQGLRTAVGDLIWKIYETQASLETLLYEHRLPEWLDRQNLPLAVPVPVATRDGATAARRNAGWQALFPLLSQICARPPPAWSSMPVRWLAFYRPH